MPGEVDEENRKRFGGEKGRKIYEAIKKKLIKEKKKKQKDALSDKQIENIKTKAAKITNSTIKDK
jgi:Fe-S cluster biosynthesis and repair protein YggX